MKNKFVLIQALMVMTGFAAQADKCKISVNTEGLNVPVASLESTGNERKTLRKCLNLATSIFEEEKDLDLTVEQTRGEVTRKFKIAEIR
jgi:hypothetical protein